MRGMMGASWRRGLSLSAKDRQDLGARWTGAGGWWQVGDGELGRHMGREDRLTHQALGPSFLWSPRASGAPKWVAGSLATLREG